jgi:hypothetical protein
VTGLAQNQASDDPDGQRQMTYGYAKDQAGVAMEHAKQCLAMLDRITFKRWRARPLFVGQ